MCAKDTCIHGAYESVDTADSQPTVDQVSIEGRLSIDQDVIVVLF